jgi:hypothetical protein
MKADIICQAAARLLIMMELAIRTSLVNGVSDKALHEMRQVVTQRLDRHIEKRVRVSEDHHSGKIRQCDLRLSSWYVRRRRLVFDFRRFGTN